MTEPNPERKILADRPAPEILERGNRRLFEKLCKAEGIDPAAAMASPVLVKLIAQQNEESRIQRARIDPDRE